eukprot:scaffold3036_cov46-Prasinocladus_malaysianus.AAC.1
MGRWRGRSASLSANEGDRGSANRVFILADLQQAKCAKLCTSCVDAAVPGIRHKGIAEPFALFTL